MGRRIMPNENIVYISAEEFIINVVVVMKVTETVLPRNFSLSPKDSLIMRSFLEVSVVYDSGRYYAP
jgi:hypothetical protein